MSASRAEDLGQLLIIGLEEDRWSSALEKRLQAIRPGGVILTQQNLRTPEATAELLAKIARTLDPPPFLALEEEGGSVDPLRAFLPPLPSPHVVAVTGLQRVEKLGSLIGEGLALLGFNMNFAPRLNLANPLVKLSLESQCFSSDPRVVAQCGGAFVTGLSRHKVTACGKHFPGLSAEEYEGASAPQVVYKPMAALWREDLMPFRQLLPKLGLVKVSHAKYKAYDSNCLIPGSLSVNVMGGLLRVKLGYRGVTVADYITALREMGNNPNVGFAGLDLETFAKSVTAGADTLVIGWTGRFLELIIGDLKKALETGTLPAHRIDEAVNRIGRAKKGLRLPTGRFSKRALDKLCRQFEEFSKECKSAEREIV